MITSYEGGVYHLLKLFEGGSRKSEWMSHSDPGFLRCLSTSNQIWASWLAWSCLTPSLWQTTVGAR